MRERFEKLKFIILVMPLEETSNMDKRRATQVKKSSKRLKRSDTSQSIDLEKPTYVYFFRRNVSTKRHARKNTDFSTSTTPQTRNRDGKDRTYRK